MTPRLSSSSKAAPDWLVAAMPPGYQNRLAEIERLTQDLETMGRFGQLLWEVGEELSGVVRETFTSLKFDTEVLTGAAVSCLAVTLDARRRVLLHLSAAEGPIQRKSVELAHVFQILNELAESTDRVVLVANCHPMTPPADRAASVGAEALQLLSRMGANFLTTSTLFSLWTLSLQDRDRARTYVERLHAQDGGAFQLPATLTA